MPDTPKRSPAKSARSPARSFGIVTGRPRGLYLRRARQGRHRASGVSQFGRSVALLYDALHDKATKDVLTAPTDTGSGGYTHKFFKVAHSREDVIAQRDAIAAWARITYGWIGRSPDYKAAFLNTLGANAEFYGKFADNASAWYKRAQEAVLFLNHALVNPPIDRNKPVEEVKDVYITIQKETDAGIYVSGAKVVATNSALTHYNFLGQNMGQEITDPSMVVMFIAPMNTPGIKLICRPSYEFAAAATGRPGTIRSRRAMTRTTPSSFSTMRSSPGKTSSSTATSSA